MAVEPGSEDPAGVAPGVGDDSSRSADGAEAGAVAEGVGPGDASSGRGPHHAVADRIDRWLVPVVQGVRRVLWVPIASGVLSAAVLVAAVLAWRGPDREGVAMAVGAVALAAVPVVGLALFVLVLGDLQRLPGTVREAPSRMGDLKGELGAAGTELVDLRRRGVLGLPGGLRWLRRTLSRLDAVGVAGVTAAVAALHPLRLVWILVLCWLSLVALPVAVVLLVLALGA